MAAMAATSEAQVPSHGGALRRGGSALLESAPVRWLRAHPDVSAALFFVGLLFAYMLPVLIGTKIMSSNDALYYWTPWQSFAPADGTHFLNPLLSDIPQSNYPWWEFTRDTLRSGTVPQWFPNTFAGAPLLSNPQNGLFTPFNLPDWLLPFNYGLGLSAGLKLWFGAFGTYLLVRQLRLGWLPGLIAGVTFAFSAYNITWLEHATPVAVAVMLPWMLWLIERLFERARLSTVLWLAVVTAVALGGGHPGTQVHVLALAGLYALIRVFLLQGLERRDRLKLLAFALGGVVLGTLMMAVMLIPEALSSHGTIGTAVRQGGGRGDLPGSKMPFDALKTVLFPDWWGRPSSVLLHAPKSSAGGSVNYNERTFYAGVVAALLAIVAVMAPGRWRHKAPFAVFAVLGLLIPVHTPVLWQILSHVPPFDVIQNQRLYLAYGLGASVLAAFAVQDLLDRPAGQRRNLVVPAVAVGIGLIVLLSIGPAGSDLGHVAKHFATGTIFHARKVIELTTTVWFLLFALGVGAALLLAFRHPRWRYGIAVGLVLLAAADSLHFAKGYQPMGPASSIIPPRTEAIDYLVRHQGDSRINALGFTLGTTWATRYGLSDIRGYAPPNPTKRWSSLWQIAKPDQEPSAPLQMDEQEDDQIQIESVLGARYIVTDAGQKLGDVSLDPVRSALRVVYDKSDAVIVENSRAAPHVEIPGRILLANGEGDANERIADPSFMPTNNVVIESRDPAVQALARGPVARGSVRIVGRQNATTTLDATLDRTGLVVLNDSLTDGWTVKVDGRKADPIRVNSVMRGVVAGPGRHTIVWSYTTPGLKAGLLLSVLAFLGLIGGAVFLVLRGRRGGAPVGLDLPEPPPDDAPPASKPAAAPAAPKAKATRRPPPARPAAEQRRAPPPPPRRRRR